MSLRKSLISVFIAAASLTAYSSQPPGRDKPNNTHAAPCREDDEIAAAYRAISFEKGHALSYSVFETAMRGYQNLQRGRMLSDRKNILSICDFNLPSTVERLWIIDLNRKKVLFNTLVAHGSGSGGRYATAFSNAVDSHQSSLGFYVTGDTYGGKHGASLQLYGLDKGFNDKAMSRHIVMHGAAYVSRDFIAHDKSRSLGNSWGCPAIPPELSKKIVTRIKDGTCLFIAHRDPHYARKSVWLNKQPPAPSR